MNSYCHRVSYHFNRSHIIYVNVKKIEKIAEKIGQKMQKDGWKGLLGIDIVYDETLDELHLIEINARQPASTTFESELQEILHLHNVAGITTFSAHLSSLLGDPVTSALIPVNDGAQILQRVTKIKNNINIKKLIESGYKIIIYNNTKPNADLVRIQSMQGILETHNKFNKRGKEIVEAVL